VRSVTLDDTTRAVVVHSARRTHHPLTTRTTAYQRDILAAIGTDTTTWPATDVA
jgi:hypothetical protein